MLLQESMTFFDDEILPNRNLYSNMRYLMNDIRDLSINMIYKQIEKNLTEKAINLVKDKIKKGFSEIVKKFKR